MTKYLGKVVVIDVEEKKFHATIDGKTKKIYTFEQIITGQVLIDYPGYDIASEAAHFNAKPESGTDRGAQPFSEHELNLYIAKLRSFGVTHWLLPGGMAKRVMSEMGVTDPQDACLAWWNYCNTNPKIRDMVRELRPTSSADLCRRQKLNESRVDCCIRIDSLASIKYVSQETENARSKLQHAFLAGSLSAALQEEFEIKILKSGPRKGVLEFSNAKVMPIYVAAVDAEGNFRRDMQGNRIGVRTILGGILQHHSHKSGKGSMASCRAKTRMRLRRREETFRKDNGILKANFPAAIPAVRQHHERMNKELVRIFRDFSN